MGELKNINQSAGKKKKKSGTLEPKEGIKLGKRGHNSWKFLGMGTMSAADSAGILGAEDEAWAKASQ